MTIIYVNWYHILCHDCGMNKEIPIPDIYSTDMAVKLGIETHNRTYCKGKNLVISITEKGKIEL